MNEPLKPLIAANWKMNGTLVTADKLVAEIISRLSENLPDCDIVLCPPFTLLNHVGHKIEGFEGMSLGAQDCSEFNMGAHTGDIAPEMLSDVGCEYVVLGHSERRAAWSETSSLVQRKANHAVKNGLTVIICVGESQSERQTGKAEKVVTEQIKSSLPEDLNSSQVVIAYEPIWAIGTGIVPTTTEISKMHLNIRETLSEKYPQESNLIRVLYGGSVKPSNVAEIINITNVDGCLVGGASLKSDTFYDICLAYSKKGLS